MVTLDLLVFKTVLSLLVNTATGGAMGDLSGYNISFEGKETRPAYFVDPTIVGAGLDFDVNAPQLLIRNN